MPSAEPLTIAAAPFCDPPPFTAEAAGHRLHFYPAGKDRLEALLALIGTAQVSIGFVCYIFSPDLSGMKVRDALTAAAQRGVKVTLLLDGFGADVDAAFFADLIAAGARFDLFMAKWSRRYLIRNHQKIVLIDGQRAMLGGFNIENSYFAPSQQGGWTDLGFVVDCPVVAQVSEWLAELLEWPGHDGAQYRAMRRMVRCWDGGDGPVQLLIGGPTRGLSSWARRVSGDMAKGRRLDMMMAYFSPSRGLIRRIKAIARRGEARLVMAAKSDNGATIGASRAFYGGLLRAGARVGEFQPAKLHTKLIVLDDAVYLGSANFDMRSLYLNLEVVLRIEDAALAEQMRGLIAHYSSASQDITPEVYESLAGPFAKARWWVSWFLVAVVDYTVTRRLNLGQ